MSKTITTTVDLVIRVEVVGETADVENCRDALGNLANVMAVQAEDGLWSLGHEDAEVDGVPSEIVATIESTKVHAVLIGDEQQKAQHDRCLRLIAIAEDLATIASHGMHVPGKKTAMDKRLGALVRKLNKVAKEIQP